MAKDGVIEVEGRVVEALPNAMFRVELENLSLIHIYMASHIGKLPVAIPAGVEVTIDGQNFSAKGPKGSDSYVCLLYTSRCV